MNPKKPKGVDIDAVNRIIRPVWPDGTRKSLCNDFNWQAPRPGPSVMKGAKAPRYESLNSRFNVTYSDNIPGALRVYVPTSDE